MKQPVNALRLDTSVSSPQPTPSVAGSCLVPPCSRKSFKPSVAAILFDMDGLLIDTESLYFEVEREIAASYGKVVADTTLQKMMGNKPLDSLSIFVSDLGIDEDPAKVLALRDGMMLEKMRRDLKSMPGMLEILQALHGRLKLAVVTGNIREFVDVMLEKFGTAPYFDLIQTSENIKKGKPDPEIFLAAAASLGIPPAECVVLEDSVNGVKAGYAAGCIVIAVPNEHTAGGDFSSATYIARDLNEARLIIERQL